MRLLRRLSLLQLLLPLLVLPLLRAEAREQSVNLIAMFRAPPAADCSSLVLGITG